MNVIVDNLLVNYERQGSGRVILLLHGWADTLETFDLITKQLEKSYEIVRLDLAGFGKSQAPVNSWGLDDYALYVSRFVEKISITPEIIVGHSNGGAISVKLISLGYMKPDKLVLLSSAGIRNSMSVRNKFWHVTAKVGKASTFLLPASAKRLLRAKLYRASGSDLMIAPHMEETFKRIVGEDIRGDALNISVPTLIIYGTEDVATPPVFAQLFHELIKNSKLQMIDGADHFAHQTDFISVAKSVDQFVSHE